jgi:hypothetical protein
MFDKKKNPEESFARGDKKSKLAEDTEDAALKSRVEGNKDAAEIRKQAEDIEQGP